MVFHAALAAGCCAIGVECAAHRHEAALYLLSALRRMVAASTEQRSLGHRLQRAKLRLGDALAIPVDLKQALTHAFLFDTVRAALGRSPHRRFHKLVTVQIRSHVGPACPHSLSSLAEIQRRRAHPACFPLQHVSATRRDRFELLPGVVEIPWPSRPLEGTLAVPNSSLAAQTRKHSAAAWTTKI